MSLVADWKQAWRWSSVRLHAFVILYLGLYAIMPSLDPNIAKLLPTPLQTPAIGLYALLGVVLRLTQAKASA